MIEPVVSAGEANVIAGEHGPADLNRLLQHVQAHPRTRIVNAETLVLNLIPGAPNAEDGPAPRDDIQRRDDLGQDTGVAIGHAGDQRAELHPPGQRSQRPEQGVRLQHRLVRPAQGRQLEEVIHDPY